MMTPHSMALAQVDRVEIKEKVNMIEALTAIIGQEVEMPNRYKIFNGDTQEELFFAVEQTDFCTRQVKQCLPDCAPWKLDILYTQGGAQQPAYKLERDWTCTFCCFNRPVVTVTDAVTGEKIGSLQDPFACCDLTFTVRDSMDNAALKLNGGCCQWGLCCPLPCGPCAEVDFPIEDSQTGSEVGHLQKRVPSCLKFLGAPDVDNYKLDFGGVKNPQYKAMLIATSIFIDFRYFNNNSNDDNGGLVGALM